ncbi:hypothetical protein [Marinomonas sp. GJ51-6]|uniref:hypothetical protein n=1 Tax=Marinomonas sp. GJ51-6 TaxID=2992802 RepID=UPI002934D92B|nr:hypothetical protein [Marinomonas sp. GJ51-6]WOD08155.1 hypothetical protein ONZ50_03120 [Marinomonas sp. GJ51-6]
MTAFSITVLFLVVGGFVVFAVSLQLKEQARLAKLRKVVSLNNQSRQVRRFLDEMPPQYQPKDMRLWLFARMLKLYDQLLDLQPDTTLTRRRNHLAEEMEIFQSGKQKRRAKPMNDEVLIVEVKRLFDSFETFLTLAQRDKVIDSDLAYRYIQLMHFFKYKINADHYEYFARKDFLSGRIDKALELYKEALSQLSPLKDSPQAQSAILKLKDIIQELEEDLALQKAEEEISKEMANEKEELDDEWSKFIEDSDFKEKKRF